MKFYILILYLSTFLLNNILMGQTVNISGVGIGSEGKTINIMKYADQLSNIPEKIASTRIDKDGNYRISFELKTVILCIFQIDYFKSELFIEPGKTYKINIIPVLANILDDKVNPYLNLTNLNAEIQKPDSNDINLLIDKLKTEYQQFIFTNFERFFQKRDKTLLDSFKTEINKKFPGINQQYFNDYLEYKIADMELMSKLESDADIITKYFTNKPILYENVKYMFLFNQLFNKYILTKSTAIKTDSLQKIISDKTQYTAFMNLLSRDKILSDTNLRELVALKQLSDLYHGPQSIVHNPQSIISLLNSFAKNCKVAEHRKIADNLIKVLTKLQPGSKAPEFLLIDNKGDELNLAKFNGKPIYLNFCKTAYPACHKEFAIMQTLYEKYREKIEFISINTDKEVIHFEKFLKTNPDYKWYFAYFADNWDLLENYEVKTYPLFILIDKEGKIIQCPALKPSENIEPLIYKLITKQ